MFLFTVAVALSFCTGMLMGSPVNVTFIGVGSYRYATAVPAIESAVSLINNLFADRMLVKLRLVFPPSIFQCEVFADSVADYVARFYYALENEEKDSSVKMFLGPRAMLMRIDHSAELYLRSIICVGTGHRLGTDTSLSNKKRFPTTITLAPMHHTVLLECFVTLLDSFRWMNIFIVCDDSPEVANYRIICRNFRVPYAFGTSQISSITFDSRGYINYDWILDQAKKSARVILLMTGEIVTRKFLIRARRKGMATPEYVYLFTMPYVATDFPELNWRAGDEDDQDAKAAFRQLLLIIFDNARVLESLSNDTQKFIIERSAAEFHYIYGKNEPISAPLVAGYETSLTMASVINESLSDGGGDLHDGRKLARRFFNRTFHLPTGDLYISKNGDRIPNILIRQLNPDTGTMESILYYVGRTQEMMNLSAFHWLNGQTPSGVPLCGFDGIDASCETQANLLPAVTAPMIILAVITGIVGLLVRRHVESLVAIQDRWWDVTKSEVTAATAKGFSSRQSQTTNGSDQRLLMRHGVHLFLGDFVWTKEVTLTRVFSPDRETLLFLAKLRRLIHVNLNPLRGIVVDFPTVTIITPYWKRGSLEDLYNWRESDWDLQTSLCRDLLEGLLYIHESFLGIHGSLRSTKCLIDNRFGLKIAAAGHDRIFAKFGQSSSDRNSQNRHALWTAPEILRQPNIHQPWSYHRKGDLFALAIILQQIITWSDPYDNASDAEKPVLTSEVVSRVKIAEVPLFRPVIKSAESSVHLRLLVEDCWAENPEHRPDVKTVLKRWNKNERSSGGQKLMYRIMKRMEDYAADLEHKITIRTNELMVERLKCDDLLKEMLPLPIVQRLRSGMEVQPEMFQEATIYFSDIVGFQAFAMTSEPITIINFLGRTYSTCDPVLFGRDVYKVETISDSYMIVSGLPIQNGHAHAAEIAKLALAMQKVFTEDCGSDDLQLRIGLHSGACAAAVIGVKALRYCLFGDTVNTASRMESHGEATKIHLSSATAEYLLRLGNFHLTPRGVISVKGKGEILTYWLIKHFSDD